MKRTPKQKIIREEVKDRHTSHWDLDMLSREELEALMTRRKDATAPVEDSASDPGHDTRHKLPKVPGKVPQG